VAETRETIAVLSRRLDQDLSDLVRKHESCVHAARRTLARGRAAGLSDSQIARRANFVAAIAEAERLTEQIKQERAQFDQTNESISARWAELERIAASVPLGAARSRRAMPSLPA
jgi:ABC-type transporter Mla subunit MlaD